MLKPILSLSNIHRRVSMQSILYSNYTRESTFVFQGRVILSPVRCRFLPVFDKKRNVLVDWHCRWEQKEKKREREKDRREEREGGGRSQSMICIFSRTQHFPRLPMSFPLHSSIDKQIKLRLYGCLNRLSSRTLRPTSGNTPHRFKIVKDNGSIELYSAIYFLFREL